MKEVEAARIHNAATMQLAVLNGLQTAERAEHPGGSHDRAGQVDASRHPSGACVNTGTAPAVLRQPDFT